LQEFVPYLVLFKFSGRVFGVGNGAGSGQPELNMSTSVKTRFKNEVPNPEVSGAERLFRIKPTHVKI
jgi:hypothetical protein